jgi:hypothetical protein
MCNLIANLGDGGALIRLKPFMLFLALMPGSVRGEAVLDQSNIVPCARVQVGLKLGVQQGVQSNITGTLDRIEFPLTPDWQSPFAVSLIHGKPVNEGKRVVTTSAYRTADNLVVADFSNSGFLTDAGEHFTIELYWDENTPVAPVSCDDAYSEGTLMVGNLDVGRIYGGDPLPVWIASFSTLTPATPDSG